MSEIEVFFLPDTPEEMQDILDFKNTVNVLDEHWCEGNCIITYEVKK